MKKILLCMFLLANHVALAQGLVSQDRRGDDTNFQIRLKYREFTPAAGELLSLPSPLDQSLERQHALFQFSILPSPDELRKYNIIALNYVPNNTLAVSVPVGFNGVNVPNLRWVGSLQASDKIGDDPINPLFTSERETAAMVVEAFTDMSGAYIEKLAEIANGQAVKHDSLPDHVRIVWGEMETFLELAEADGVSWMYPASEDMLQNRPVFYCPGSLTPYGPVAGWSANGNGWDGPGQGAATLSYYFANGTGDIFGFAEWGPIIDALGEWSNVADLQFNRTFIPNSNRSFDIRWANGNHGDGHHFDGPNGVLAHAFYPTNVNSEPIAGDIHFDEAETWHLTGNTHMFTVALHEIGHSLGLNHSSVSGSVMFPTYSGAVTGLAQDDINGIRSIYASSSSDCIPSLSNGICPADLNWTACPNATTYELWRSSSTYQNYPNQRVYSGPNRNYTFIVRQGMTPFNVWVRACTNGICGDWSNSRRVSEQSCYITDNHTITDETTTSVK